MPGNDLWSYQSLCERYLRQGRHLSSAYAFAAVFLWKDFFRFSFEEREGRLSVFAAHDTGTFLYWPPLGAAVAPEAMAETLGRLRAASSAPGAARVENVEPAGLPRFSSPLFHATLKGYETFYFKEDVVRMAGGGYKSRRGSYNQCVRSYACRFAPYDPSLREECLALYDRWQARRRDQHADEVYRQMLAENRVVHGLALARGPDLGLVGRVVTVDGRVRAYTFGYRVRHDIFCVLLEIADPDYRGLPVYIFREFCADQALAAARFINVMDDFAMPQVERAKRLFRPVFFNPVYTVTLKEDHDNSRRC